MAIGCSGCPPMCYCSNSMTRPISNPTARLCNLACCVLMGSTGCATIPYEFGKDLENDDNVALAAQEPQVERGEPRGVVDFIGCWFFGLPSKILLLNLKVDNHDISPETEAVLREYLARNDLKKVKVRLNQYSPGAEWSRLADNHAIHPGWRWTFGAIATALYTVFPGRVFGGDNYNPYTNTINLYSDHPAIALHEAGHAKDAAEKRLKGTYAALYALPLAPLWHEADATGDVMGYLQQEDDVPGQKRAYRILYPAYFTYIGGSITQFIPEYDLLISLGAVIPGHIVGQTRAFLLKEKKEDAATLQRTDDRHGNVAADSIRR